MPNFDPIRQYLRGLEKRTGVGGEDFGKRFMGGALGLTQESDLAILASHLGEKVFTERNGSSIIAREADNYVTVKPELLEFARTPQGRLANPLFQQHMIYRLRRAIESAKEIISRRAAPLDEDQKLLLEDDLNWIKDGVKAIGGALHPDVFEQLMTIAAELMLSGTDPNGADHLFKLMKLKPSSIPLQKSMLTRFAFAPLLHHSSNVNVRLHAIKDLDEMVGKERAIYELMRLLDLEWSRAETVTSKIERADKAWADGFLEKCCGMPGGGSLMDVEAFSGVHSWEMESPNLSSYELLELDVPEEYRPNVIESIRANERVYLAAAKDRSSDTIVAAIEKLGEMGIKKDGVISALVGRFQRIKRYVIDEVKSLRIHHYWLPSLEEALAIAKALIRMDLRGAGKEAASFFLDLAGNRKLYSKIRAAIIQKTLELHVPDETESLFDMTDIRRRLDVLRDDGEYEVGLVSKWSLAILDGDDSFLTPDRGMPFEFELTNAYHAARILPLGSVLEEKITKWLKDDDETVRTSTVQMLAKLRHGAAEFIPVLEQMRNREGISSQETHHIDSAIEKIRMSIGQDIDRILGKLFDSSRMDIMPSDIWRLGSYALQVPDIAAIALPHLQAIERLGVFGSGKGGTEVAVARERIERYLQSKGIDPDDPQGTGTDGPNSVAAQGGEGAADVPSAAVKENGGKNGAPTLIDDNPLTIAAIPQPAATSSMPLSVYTVAGARVI